METEQRQEATSGLSFSQILQEKTQDENLKKWKCVSMIIGALIGIVVLSVGTIFIVIWSTHSESSINKPRTAASHRSLSNSFQLKCSRKDLNSEEETFKIVQITDTHYGESETEDRQTDTIINHILDWEKPDFVALSGDIVSGISVELSTCFCKLCP